MVKSYQEQQELNKQSEPAQSVYFATIGNVNSSGVTLIFDGESTATTKRYKVNKAGTYVAGNRVKVAKISGTYIVEYVISNTGS